jgi:hypothetical protein
MRGVRYAVLASGVLALISAPVTPLSAQNNETPGNKHAWRIEPYACWGATADIMQRAAMSQGYVVEYYSNTDIDLDPDVTIPDVKDAYGSGAGAGMIWSHGGVHGHSIEIYPHTLAGFNAREAQWGVYMNEGYWGEIYRGEVQGSDSSYTIGVLYQGGVSQWSDCDSAIIDNECCHGGVVCDCWSGARVVFGPPHELNGPEITANLRAIWEGLDGVRGKEDRVAGHAYLDANPQTLIMCRNGHTTLAPAVKAYYPPEGFIIGEDSVDAWVAFDTKMDISGDADKLVHGSSGAVVNGARWVRGERDTLRFTLWSVNVDDECFAVLGDHMTTGDTLKSEGGMALDGNLNPDRSDGEGPNRDAFGMLCDCRYYDPNYAAALGSRWAYVDGGDVSVGWHVEAEWETREYVVEGGSGDRWQEVGRVARGAVVAPDVYALRVDGGYDLYRIVEIDKSGKQSRFRPMAVRDSAPPFLAMLLNRPAQPMGSARIGEACRPSGTGRLLAGGPLSPEVPDWVFYGPDSLLAECGPAVSWFESKGYSVDLVSATSPYY